VISTASELACIFEALFTGQLLTPALLAEMLTPVPVPVPGTHPLFGQPGYGLGVMMDSGSWYGVVAGHGGEGPGYAVGALHLPSVGGHRVTSVALTNRDRGDLGLQVALALVAGFAEQVA